MKKIQNVGKIDFEKIHENINVGNISNISHYIIIRID